jgi:DNA-binding MarR family transcriptional regulator
MSAEERAKRLAKVILEVVPPVMRTIKAQMREMGSRGGTETLTVPQFRVLNKLARMSMSNQQLSVWMGVSAPTMSKIVDNLVARRLVTRKSERSDRRQVIVECTVLGLALSQSIRGSVQKKLARKISVLSQSQLSSLETGLLVLKETFL